ncbi:sigma-70 family RNA polymerase sigma factor [Dubosiella newyorkensis]|uniref:Uncharacterized protein n=3 Tax=Dubosiella newyorkensis TaxID=1862672 RepID=A0A1U7NLV2_9FIRM|nr:sigma-70 family RNA polymerase sigma factor [Dubosiella newyorkensis]OLU45988.1 hypothetical protein BO225_07495 [Dubosiella newyorkensis]
MEQENIYELIYLYFLKDDEAIARLIEYYRPLVYRLLKEKRSFSRTQDGWFEDRLALADTVLLDCLESYRPYQNIPFTVYYKSALQNKLIDEGKYEQRHSLNYHFDVVSLDRKVKEDGVTQYVDLIADPQAEHAKNTLIKDWIDSLQEQKLFSAEDLEVIKLKAEGYKQSEISRMTGKSRKYIRKVLDQFKNWYLNN